MAAAKQTVQADAGQARSGRKRGKDRPPARVGLRAMSLLGAVSALPILFVMGGCARPSEGEIRANTPEVVHAPVRALAQVTIELSPAGIDGAGVSMRVKEEDKPLANVEELFAYLTQLKQQSGEGFRDIKIIIRPTDGRVRWEHVVNAFNQAVRARFRLVGFAGP